MEISGKTGLLGLIGSPVGHSGSPAMYNYSFELLDMDYKYLAFDIKLDKVENAISAIKTFNMKGANVTMPCKSDVCDYMDELSPAARIIGACNTIVNDNGKLIGHITDGQGYVRNLKEKGVEVEGKKLTIMGAGGAATAIQVQCALDGAREIAIFNKKDNFFERAQKTVEDIKKEVPTCIIKLYDLNDTEKLYDEIANSDILTNATLVGMKPYENDTNILDTNVFRKDLVVTDVVYNPIKTKMILDAKDKGCKVIGGKGMLLYQGVEAFKLFTGKDMPVKEVRAKYFAE
ncbi:shikimate dehydrogenase [Terrisporobacter hibernicus]|uniref:Shikimate dehydrogenase (NADP(+)) n=1 Tax=Terrisporobacter hibernicus TaxID=2813371 RepID=A0AAX2ZET7_9FIRM|nr:shikimate dehydrogenase [Terrisporobacter hibernicus]UEL46875.1 shikimate dehydrogenase [Terrisporobacter hibernicus]